MSMLPRLCLVLWVALAPALLSGCGANEVDEERPALSDDRPHIFFLLLDTLRADHLGLYGYERDTSPMLERFAESAVVFENVQSQAPCTFPSANSMLTGRYTGHFLLRPERDLGIPPDIESLPKVLARNGYDTLAISASPIVRKTPSKNNPTGGFGAGFGIFDEACLWGSAECVQERLLAHLDELPSRGKPLFTFLHYMDAHDPYVLPEDHAYLFASSYEGDNPAVAAGRIGLVKKRRGEGTARELETLDLRHLVDLYDERIRHLDGRLGELFELLERRGLLDGSLIVIAADHGEQFDEHASVAHCNSLYQEELATPLVLRLPDGRSGRRKALVENVDIVPTVLDYAGIDVLRNGIEFDGRSLRPLVESETESGVRATAFALWGRNVSIRDEDFKLITNGREGTMQLFDLRDDPGELRALELTDIAEHERLLLELNDWFATRAGVDPDLAGSAGVKTIEQLRALGYFH